MLPVKNGFKEMPEDVKTANVILTTSHSECPLVYNNKGASTNTRQSVGKDSFITNQEMPHSKIK